MVAGIGGGFNLGAAYGKVIIDPSGVSTGMDRARQDFENGTRGMGAGLKAVGDQISALGGSLTVLTAPLLAFGVTGIQSASNFQDALKEIEVRARLTTDEMERVRAKALEIGRDTVFSSGQAIESFLQLTTAGQSVEEAYSTIDAVMSGAAASGMDLGTMADVVTDALAMFNLTADQSTRVVDGFIKAEGAGSTTTAELYQGLQNAGSAARDFGLSFEDTVAILGVFRDNGIKGAEAGTQINSMLTNMMRPTEDVQGMWAKLGVSMFDATGTMRPLNDIIRDLNTSMAGLTQQERLEAIQTLAGSYGRIGLSTLLNTQGFGAYAEAMNAATDAQTVAEAKMDTFSGSVENLGGSIDNFRINTLTPLMDNNLRPIVDRVTDVVNVLNDWATANPVLAGQIVRVLGVMTALGPVLLIVGKVIAAIGGIIGFFTTGVLGPLIAILGGVYLAFETNFLGIQDFLQPVLDNIAMGFDTLFGVIGNFGNIVEDKGVGTAIASVVNAFMQMLGLVENDQMSPAAQQMGDGIVTAFLTVKTFLETQVLPVLQALGNWFLVDVLPSVVSFVAGVATQAIQLFFTFLGNAWAVIGPALESIGRWFLTEALPAIVDFIVNTVVPTIGRFFEILGQVWAIVGPALGDLFNWFVTTGLPAIRDFIVNEVMPRVQDFIDLLVGIWTTVGPALGDLFNWFMTTGLPAVRDFIVNEAIPRIQDFVDVLQGIWTIVSIPLGQLKDWFTTTGTPGINTAIGEVQRVWGLLQGAFTDMWNVARPLLQPIVDWFRDAFQRITDFIQPVIDVVAGFIRDAQHALDLLRQIGGGAPNTVTVPGGVQFGNVPAFADGTDWIPRTMLGLLHPGEAVLTADENAARLSGNSTSYGGDTFGDIYVTANDYAGGQAAARGFKEEIAALRRSRK